MSEWTLIPPGRSNDLSAARLQAHYAVQIVAAAGNTLLAKRTDDAQQALEFECHTETVGSPVLTPQGHRLGLDIAGLQLRVTDGNHVSIDTFDLIGKTLVEGTDWASQTLSRICGAAIMLQRPVHHDFPNHRLASGAVFEQAPGLEIIAHGFANAEGVLRARANEKSLKIWPHHFDIAFLVPGKRAESSVGVGWSPGDGGIDEPYFYVTPSPYPSPEIELPTLPRGGQWHTQGWTGAVLAYRSLVREDARAQAHQVETFLDAAIMVCERWVSE